jgi:copper chaperone CopZ
VAARCPVAAVQYLKSSREITMQTEHLKVTGMTCGGCASNVTHALEALSGVRNVQVSLSAAEATVEYDERLATAGQLKSAIVGAGYGVGGSATAGDSQSKGSCCA